MEVYVMLQNTGPLNITNSTFYGNSAGRYGGGCSTGLSAIAALLAVTGVLFRKKGTRG
jgi:hypothetical protein